MSNAYDEKNLPAAVGTDDDNAEAEMMLASGRFDNFDLSADLSAGRAGYCSMVAEDNKSRVTLYNACNQPEKLAAHLGEQIQVLHVFIEIIPVVNKITGSIDKAPRVVLIDKTGKGYQAVSVGIYNAVKQMIAMFGDPGTWSGPHTVKIVNVPLEGGFHTFTLQLID